MSADSDNSQVMRTISREVPYWTEPHSFSMTPQRLHAEPLLWQRKIQSVLQGDLQRSAETTDPSAQAESNKVVSPITSETLVSSCQRVMPGTLERLPVLNRRKVGMTSSPHGPYVLGYTRATMAVTVGSQAAMPC